MGWVVASGSIAGIGLGGCRGKMVAIKPIQQPRVAVALTDAAVDAAVGFIINL